MSAISQFIVLFGQMMVIMNPVGIIAPYTALTKGMEEDQKIRLAKISVILSSIILTAIVLVSHLLVVILTPMTLALQIVGGLILCRIGIAIWRNKSENGKINNISPFVFPIIAGPGTITAILLIVTTENFGKERTMNSFLLILVLLIILILMYLCMKKSEAVAKKMGDQKLRIFIKFVGLLILTIGADLLTHGIQILYMRNLQYNIPN